MPMSASSLAVHANSQNPFEVPHKSYCFAGQPAPCKGLFPDDALPCVCGVIEDVVFALSLIAAPVADLLV